MHRGGRRSLRAPAERPAGGWVRAGVWPNEPAFAEASAWQAARGSFKVARGGYGNLPREALAGKPPAAPGKSRRPGKAAAR